MMGPMVMAPPADKCPLTVLDLKDSYCSNLPLVFMRIQNPAAEATDVSLRVDKKTKAGEWERFVEDMFLEAAHPMQTTVITLDGHAEIPVQWRPPKWMTREPLGEGRYRVVALVGPGSGLPRRACPLKGFVVTRAVCR